jgi:CubicO group peptidase (beta-lactamase class C family)
MPARSNTSPPAPVVSDANPELEITSDNKGRWNMPEQRRFGFHHLNQINRYSVALRAARVMRLDKRIDPRIGRRDDVRLLTGLPSFSALVVVRGQHLLHEQYASDFGPRSVHSIQSITKTIANLIIGSLWRDGLIELDRKVSHYLPEIGSGYAEATVQAVLDMGVSNEYSEDFSDPNATYYLHEESMGWRLPRDPADEDTAKRFLAGLRSDDICNPGGTPLYKDANTDVLGWIAERVGGRPLRAFLADIVDAAGLEHQFSISTDRTGFPALDGGGVMCARDLARYGSLFVRGGLGINGNWVGCPDFIARALDPCQGLPWDRERPNERYCNQLETDGRYVGHSGYGGQYVLADMTSGVVGVFFSVVENKDGLPSDEEYAQIIGMLSGIARMNPASP